MRLAIIGPTYPYRGGIAHYTTLLARECRQRHTVRLISFSRQYPRWLFPGQSDRDPSQHPLQTDAEYWLDGLNPLTWRQTARRLRAWQPEAVIISWWVPYWAPAWAALTWLLRRAPHPPRLLFICHNVLPHESGPLDRAAARLALGRADGFLAHSQADAALLRQMFPHARVIATALPTYADLGQTAAPATLPIELPSDRPLLLFFGFVRPYKGLDVLLRALPAVLAQQPVHLLVVGEFWQGEAAYQALIERMGVAEAVTLWNQYVPDEQLVACVRRADAAVLPYRSATQSAVAQVAFGQGTPVITTNVGGLAEAVQDGRTGLVVPPDDPAALAAAINRFLGEKLGPTMRAHIAADQDRFSWGNLVRALEDLCA
ncbi:MAG: glycosyltransferase [Ardenticatenales bacterium]|nr:glycosyltransferase [Ardenticatenales bacterium]